MVVPIAVVEDVKRGVKSTELAETEKDKAPLPSSPPYTQVP